MKQYTKRIKILLSDITTLLFPYSPDERVLALCDDSQFITYYQPILTTGVWTLLPYKNKTIRSAVHLCKFKNHPRSTTLLARVLHEYLKTITEPAMIIPIPLSSIRFRERGYNQVENIIQKALYQMHHITLQKNILIRTKHTAPQVSLKRADRLQNVQGAFTITNKASKLVPGAHILLIDDVHTTGATLKAARATLEPLSPASITCIALAH